MSKLLKSKIILGFMIVAIALVGFASFSKADCSLGSTTLKYGQRSAAVTCLQTSLNVTPATGYFGKLTLAAVKAFQANKGLTADGLVGAMTKAQITTGTVPPVVTGFAPAGCTAASGFSPVTGGACYAVGTTPTPVTGPLSLSLASDTPAAGYVLANQATADMLHFNVSGTGVLGTVVLHRSGISSQNTLSNVYLYDGVTRLTDGYSFNTAGDLTINNINLAISGTKTLSVKVDGSSTAGNDTTIAIAVTSFTSVGGTANAVNVQGNMMYLGTSSSLATVKFDGLNSGCSGGCNVNTGVSAYTVWSQAMQVNTRTVMLKSANFRMSGSAPVDAFANIKLYVDGIDSGKVGVVIPINGSNYAMFDMTATPISLTTGTHTLDLRADIFKGASYNVTTSVQTAADLTVYDPQIGVNIAVSTQNGASMPSSGGQLNINAGTGSFTIDPTFLSATNISGGTTGAVIAKYKIHGYSEDVKVQTLSVTPVLVNCTPSCATEGLQNVELYFNGSQVGTATNSTAWLQATGALSFNLGSQMIVPAGMDSVLEVRADLRTTGSVNYTAGTVSADLTAVTSNAQGQTSHSNVTLPASNITGHTLAIQTGVLAVSKSTGYANQSVTPNTANVKIGSYTLQNQSTSAAVRVTSLLVAMKEVGGTAMTSATTPALTNFSNLKTSETSGSGSIPVQPQGSNTFSVDFTLAPGAVKTIDVLADTSSATGTSFSTTLVVTSLSSNVAVSQNGTGYAVTGQVISLSSGTLTNPPTMVTASSTAQQFVAAAGGADSATKATFKLLASGGAVTVTELKLTVNSQDLSTASTDADAGSTGSQALTVTSRTGFALGDVVELVGTTNGYGTITGGTGTGAGALTVYITTASTGTPTAVRLIPATVTSIKVGTVTAPVVAGVAYLTGLNLSVPNGTSGLAIDAYVSYAPVGMNGIMSGATSRVALEYVKYSGGNGTSTLCTTAISASCTAPLSSAVSAPTMKVVGSRPTLALASSGGVLVQGTTDVGTITVTADTKGDVVLTDLPISVGVTDATLTNANPGYNADGIRVKDAQGNLVTTTNTQFSTTTTGGNSTITFTNGYTIPAGTSASFHIYLYFATAPNTNGAHTSAATLSLGSSSLLSWTDTAGNALTTTGVDVIGSAATTTSNKYLYGTTVPGFFYNYPTNTVSVSS